MPRPTFTPDDTQRATLDALARLARRRKKLDKEADELMVKADEQGIPISWIADTAQVQRKTVYRHLGRKMA
ncbi:helix-turn-helix domain-containing protein [Micromonospora carbonacea]|uniref:Helix-turn-helix domain of resolvase n=1 Tax=Micromonospora carbonacea TaxID=47853 RepID=A0A1C5AAV7_9ACTN|nr:helix-turn-helix domain-containing protein [Micromonospora carbonacea]SCF42256.1 Helix-turn-helix domain of resolvase [Micromonospora carbonacea]